MSRWVCVDCKKPVAKGMHCGRCLQPSVDESAVSHPAHYNQGKIEVIEFIEDKGLNFHLGNAVKYISRAGKKGGMEKYVEDLRKACWYLDRAIELQAEAPRRPNDMNPRER